jgi:hypothetical protein
VARNLLGYVQCAGLEGLARGELVEIDDHVLAGNKARGGTMSARSTWGG